MSGTGPGRNPPAGIPTLTEVVPWPGQAPIAPAPTPTPAPLPPAPPAYVAAAPAAAPLAAEAPVAVPAPPPAAAPIVAPVPASAALPAAPLAPAAVAAPAVPTPTPAPINETQLVQHVLADLQRQIDLMLEVRLREALAPVLARATDTLIRDARKELTVALRDAVTRAVAQELSRREDR